MRHIILDTETTGLHPNQGDRIVEIGCIELENRRPTGKTLHFYMNPESKQVFVGIDILSCVGCFVTSEEHNLTKSWVYINIFI